MQVADLENQVQHARIPNQGYDAILNKFRGCEYEPRFPPWSSAFHANHLSANPCPDFEIQPHFVAPTILNYREFNVIYGATLQP